MSCHNLTVEHNTIAEINGAVLLTIDTSTLYPSNTVISGGTGGTTTINIINNDG